MTSNSRPSLPTLSPSLPSSWVRDPFFPGESRAYIAAVVTRLLRAGHYHAIQLADRPAPSMLITYVLGTIFHVLLFCAVRLTRPLGEPVKQD